MLSSASSFFIPKKYNLKSIEEGIDRWKKNPCEKNKSQLIEDLSPYLYYYSLICFRQYSEDMCSDFYLVAVEKIENIMKKYNFEKGTKFITYLSKSLYYLWIDFQKQQKKKSQNCTSLEEGKFYYDLSDNELTHTPNVKIQNLFNNISNKKHYLIIKLYYYDFFNENDFLCLKKEINKSYGECLIFFHSLLDEVLSKKNKQHQYELKTQKIMNHLLSSSNFISYLGKEVSNDSWVKYLHKNVDYYYKVRTYPSYKKISDIFNCKPVDISNIINNFKSKIKKERNLYEFLE